MAPVDVLRPEKTALATVRDHLRVLYVIDESRVDAVSDHLIKGLRRLKRMQLRAAVVSLGPHGDATERIQSQDLPVVSLEAADAGGLRGLSADLRALFGLRTVIGRFRPQVLHALGPRSRLLAGFAALFRPGLKVIDGPFIGPANRGFRRSFEGLSHKVGAGRVLIVEDAERARTARDRFGAEQPVEVVGHLIDAAAARSSAVWGFDRLPGDRYYVGASVAPGACSDLRRLLEAFRIFSAHRSDAVLLVLGDAAHMKPGSWPEDLRIEDRVMFVRPPTEAAMVLRRLSVLWVTGDPRPDQESILQAMTVGTPVVCDSTTDLGPLIERIGGALMRDRRWPRQFAEATRDLERDPALHRAVSAAGRALVDQCFPAEAWARKVRDLYARVALADDPGPEPSPLS